MTLKNLAKKIVRVFESKSKVVFDSSKETEKEFWCMDVEKARKELNFKARYSLDEGLKECRKAF